MPAPAKPSPRRALQFLHHPMKTCLAIGPLLLSALVAATAGAQDAPPAPAQAAASAAASAPVAAPAALPPLPAPMNVPQPGPDTGAPYAPQPILPGGVVVTLFPPGSPYLNMARVHEPEQYSLDRAVPGRISSIVNIHNPSIEVHTVDSNLNTGAAVILAAGGGHNTLNVGSESADFVPYFFNYGVTTIILRNRLRTSGYDPKTDEVYDALQAIKLVRAHAADWRIDPDKIGIMGFSAGPSWPRRRPSSLPTLTRKTTRRTIRWQKFPRGRILWA